MGITFDTETIRLDTLFEIVTKATIKDCFVNDSNDIVFFIVDEGKIGLAIGRDGKSVRQVEKLIKKRIKVFEFSKDLAEFARNVIPHVNNLNVRNNGSEIIVEVIVDKKNKAMVIGRDGRNLELYTKLLNRTHGVSDVVVK